MDSEPTLRRSKREHQPSAKAASSTSLSTVSSSASRRSQRRRAACAASPASTSVSPQQMALVRDAAPSSEAPSHSPTLVDPIKPLRQQRRIRAAAHTGVKSRGTQGTESLASNGVPHGGKVLGRYSSHDCAVLCEVILNQLKTQTLAPSVLDETKSPAFIQWEPVAKTMETRHKVRMKAQECQVLWKFLAYGTLQSAPAEACVSDSDEEVFCQTPAVINAQVVHLKEENRVDKTVSVVALDPLKKGVERSRGGDEAKTAKRFATSNQANAVPLQLYPTYSLPTGVPDAWYRPFGPKDAMPLTFVASRFLRRKTSPLIHSHGGTSGTPPVARQNAGQVEASEQKRTRSLADESAPAVKIQKVATSVVIPSSSAPGI